MSKAPSVGSVNSSLKEGSAEAEIVDGRRIAAARMLQMAAFLPMRPIIARQTQGGGMGWRSRLSIRHGGPSTEIDIMTPSPERRILRARWPDQYLGNRRAHHDASPGDQKSAAAKTGNPGAAFAGAMSVATGIWLYQLTDDGLALELIAKGFSITRTPT
jgi:hypothetical protein